MEMICDVLEDANQYEPSNYSDTPIIPMWDIETIKCSINGGDTWIE